MIDLEQLAEANRVHLEAKFEELLVDLPLAERNLIIKFSEWVRSQCRITINVKLSVVCDLINRGEYMNIYQAATQYSDALGISEQDLLRAWLGSFYDRRIAFDSAFENGKKFNYGALTA